MKQLQLEKQIKNNKVSHAYIFYGKYCDKMDRADWFCEQLNCNKFDVIKIQGEKNIPIEEIRALRKQMGLAPHAGSWKVAIISPGELLAAEAQNALLKLLEEPPARSVLVILVDSLESLLSTIVSRCQRVEIETYIKLVKEQGIEIPEGLLQGKWSLQERFVFAERLAKENNLPNVLNGWLIDLRQKVVDNSNSYHLELIEKIWEAKKMLESNGSARLIMESLMVDFEGR
jgi:hypothetical protein